MPFCSRVAVRVKLHLRSELIAVYTVNGDPSTLSESLTATTESVEELADELLAFVRKLKSCTVAFSGGVDSAVVAAAAAKALGENSVAVTADSPSLPKGELQAARELAARIGIRHNVIETQEMQSVAYRANRSDRCYHCKTELYRRLDFLREREFDTIVNGTNADDLQDYRPGLTAASEHGVVSPLAECRIGKTKVRAIAKLWGLPVWDKPAGPCLSSRLAYGETVTEEKLARIDRAEKWLHGRGFREVRVRYHAGDLARVEVLAEEIDSLILIRTELVAELRRLGFRLVTIDLEGFRSGSLNTLVELDSKFTRS